MNNKSSPFFCFFLFLIATNIILFLFRNDLMLLSSFNIYQICGTIFHPLSILLVFVVALVGLIVFSIEKTNTFIVGRFSFLKWVSFPVLGVIAGMQLGALIFFNITLDRWSLLQLTMELQVVAIIISWSLIIFSVILLRDKLIDFTLNNSKKAKS